MILIGDDINKLEKLKKRLANNFEIKYLGILEYFLWIKFVRTKEGVFVNKEKYVFNLLGEICLLGCKTNKTLIKPNVKL